MRLLGRKRSRDEYEGEDEQAEEVSAEELLEVGVFEQAEKKREEAEGVGGEAIQVKEPWVVKGETWLQAVKLEKQVSSH